MKSNPLMDGLKMIHCWDDTVQKNAVLTLSRIVVTTVDSYLKSIFLNLQGF